MAMLVITRWQMFYPSLLEKSNTWKSFEVVNCVPMATLLSGRTIGATIEVDPPTSIIHSEAVSRWDMVGHQYHRMIFQFKTLRVFPR